MSGTRDDVQDVQTGNVGARAAEIVEASDSKVEAPSSNGRRRRDKDSGRRRKRGGQKGNENGNPHAGVRKSLDGFRNLTDALADDANRFTILSAGPVEEAAADIITETPLDAQPVASPASPSQSRQNGRGTSDVSSEEIKSTTGAAPQPSVKIDINRANKAGTPADQRAPTPIAIELVNRKLNGDSVADRQKEEERRKAAQKELEVQAAIKEEVRELVTEKEQAAIAAQKEEAELLARQEEAEKRQKAAAQRVAEEKQKTAQRAAEEKARGTQTEEMPGQSATTVLKLLQEQAPQGDPSLNSTGNGQQPSKPLSSSTGDLHNNVGDLKTTVPASKSSTQPPQNAKKGDWGYLEKTAEGLNQYIESQIKRYTDPDNFRVKTFNKGKADKQALYVKVQSKLKTFMDNLIDTYSPDYSPASSDLAELQSLIQEIALISHHKRHSKMDAVLGLGVFSGNRWFGASESWKAWRVLGQTLFPSISPQPQLPAVEIALRDVYRNTLIGKPGRAVKVLDQQAEKTVDNYNDYRAVVRPKV